MRRVLGLALIACALETLAAPGVPEGCPAPDPALPETWAGERTWRTLARAGYRFGTVTWRIEDVYGSDAEDPDAWYARTLNALHRESRPGALEPHLLFAPGERVDAEIVHQTERRLRGLRYLREARLRPLRCVAGVVEVEAETHDAWTLKFGLDFKSVGGQSSNNLYLSDINFLGTGKSVYVRRASDALRDTTTLGYHDPALFGSRWTFGAEHATLSDGISNYGVLARPFATYTTPWAFRVVAADTRQTLSFHDAGEIAWQTRGVSEQQEVAAWRLLAWDGDQGWRAGLAWRESRNFYGPLIAVDPALRPPPQLLDRERRGVVFSLARFHDHWATFRDLRSIGRTEDVNLGLDATLRLGHFPAEFTSTTSAWTFDLDADWAARLGDERLLIAQLDTGLRRETGGDTRDGRLDLEGALYTTVAPGRTRVLHLGLHQRQQPDPEHHLYLGGADGLLGYPTNFIAADRAWTVHFAERLVTRHVWFQTLRVGWTVFAEAGRAQRTDGRGWAPILMDVGGGLRLGNLRGTDPEPIYISLAVPVNREPNTSPFELVMGVALDF